MRKILTFKVGIEGLENKIWREIEIDSQNTVADLAYTILASFDSLAYHLYNIRHGQTEYYAMEPEIDFDDTKAVDAKFEKLENVDFSDDRMIMEYDFGSPTTFIIKYVEAKEVDENNKKYPLIVDGAGKGMIDDLADFELKEIVEETDDQGYSTSFYTPGYEREYIYDYRDYKLDYDNFLIKERFSKIKEGYEKLN